MPVFENVRVRETINYRKYVFFLTISMCKNNGMAFCYTVSVIDILTIFLRLTFTTTAEKRYVMHKEYAIMNGYTVDLRVRFIPFLGSLLQVNEIYHAYKYMLFALFQCNVGISLLLHNCIVLLCCLKLHPDKTIRDSSNTSDSCCLL